MRDVGANVRAAGLGVSLQNLTSRAENVEWRPRPPLHTSSVYLKALSSVRVALMPMRTWMPMNAPVACVFDFSQTVPFAA